ncbi:MAG TPA: hypothetical protein V6D02_00295 [Candidatus Obscuribacterales bacterium]
MLDVDVFGKWIDLLSQHYGKPISDDLAEHYYSEFEHLSDAQFERGARLCMRREPRFPPLDRIIELAKVTGERRAELKEFQPDATPYDPNIPEAKAARAAIRQQLAVLGAVRSPAPQSGMTALGDTLSGVPLAAQRPQEVRLPAVRRAS